MLRTKLRAAYSITRKFKNNNKKVVTTNRSIVASISTKSHSWSHPRPNDSYETKYKPMR